MKLSEKLSFKRYSGVFKSYENYGFIDGTNLYVRYENINTALNKDRVEYVILKGIEKDKYEAKIVNIQERYKVFFVGTIIHKEEKQDYVMLDDPKINKVVITNKSAFDIGSKVKILLENFEIENLKGKVEKKIEVKNDLEINTIAALEDYGIDVDFDKEVEAEVEKINLDIEKYQNQNLRKNFENIPFVTIDPDNSKDYDDAIAVLKKEEDFHLYVAIADVWTYIKNNPQTIKEASKRGTSIYFLDHVIPMLPEKLSNVFCSLMENEKRCAIVIDCLIDKNGNLNWKSININPGIIKSRNRLTYDEVNNFFQTGKAKKEISDEVKTSLWNGLQLYKLLENKRIEKGYISIENAEIKIKLNIDKSVDSIYKYHRAEAQIMIENFMVTANEIIATTCMKQKIPTIYRIHELPDPSKISFFISEARKLNFKIPDEDYSSLDLRKISKWFRNNQDNPNLEIIGLLLHRSLQKARYSTNNTGHFGLNLKNYLHFTSPIRRFPDAMVHKMLWKYLFEKNKNEKNKDNEYLQEISEHCTNKEIESTEISRYIENLKIIEFLNTKINKVFKGQVIARSKQGGIIRIEKLNIDGYVKSKNTLNIGEHVLVKPIYNTKEFKMIKTL